MNKFEMFSALGDIEDIQFFGMNIFISTSEAKNAYFMSGEATNEIYFFSLHGINFLFIIYNFK